MTDKRPGRYVTYKRATQSFMTWLNKASKLKTTGVAAILDKVGAVVSQAMHPPPGVLSDLRTSIRLRQEVSSMYARLSPNTTSENFRHTHFISVLQGAYDGLAAMVSATSTRASQTEGKTEKETDESFLANSFAALQAQQPATDTSADECDIKAGPVSAPEGVLVGCEARLKGLSNRPDLNGKLCYADSFVKETGRYRIWFSGHCMSVKPENLEKSESGTKELLVGETAAVEAEFLLLDMMEVMQEIDKAWTEYKSGTISLLAATAVTNECIRYIQLLASNLELRWKMLKTLEDVIAAGLLGGYLNARTHLHTRTMRTPRHG